MRQSYRRGAIANKALRLSFVHLRRQEEIATGVLLLLSQTDGVSGEATEVSSLCHFLPVSLCFLPYFFAFAFGASTSNNSA